jgi:carbonic anhydrase
MSIISEIMEHNQTFVKDEVYRDFETTKFPNKKMVILTCMDTRLTELLPKAIGFCNGDAKIIKNAGALISHPFGSVMRSILVAIYELGAEEVCVIGHKDCGMSGLRHDSFLGKVKEKGIDQNQLDFLRSAGIDLEKWLTGFDRVEDSVAQSVTLVRNHPLLPEGIKVHGLVIDPHTGGLTTVEIQESVTVQH